MQADFWLQRWAANQIGFHQLQASPYLPRFWPQLAVPSGARVLVPLCGKSLDLIWLVRQGYQVRGVELSQTAVEAFFREHQLEAEVSRRGVFQVYSAGSVELWCGDFFALEGEHVTDCAAFYDRAALIALPAGMRERYVALLSTLLPDHCQGLLVTLDYDQTKIEGPPFSVADNEVQRLFAAQWQVENAQSYDVLHESQKFVQRGVERLDERVYRLAKSRT